MAKQANTAPTPPGGVEFVQLDPRTLAAHPANVRADLGDLTELAASIRAVGVLEPVVVAPDDGNDNGSNEGQPGYRIIAGHRRVAAAISAKQATVPCVLRPDLAGDVDALTGMIVENVLRADLTPAEEAAAYAQLAAFDLTPAAIARRTGRPAKTVRDALALHALPTQVKDRVAEQAMTLADAAAIEEFAGDPKAYARLLKAADTGYGLQYALADERHRRDKKQRTDATKTNLTEQGVTVVGTPKGWSYYCKEARIGDLALADGTTRYTDASHAGCPSHAAFLDRDGQPMLICRDPDSHGHVRLTGTNYVTPEEAARRDAEAAARQQRADALTVAADVRRAFVRDLVNRPKPPGDLLRHSLAILFTAIEDTRSNHLPLFADLLGVDTGEQERGIGRACMARLDKTSDARLWQHTVAHVAALAEANLDRLATGRGWGYRPGLTVTWLDLLTTYGYQPSDIEQQVRDDAERQDAAEQAEDDDDLDSEDVPADDAGQRTATS
jgi:ParB family chromosome partitioning protein